MAPEMEVENTRPMGAAFSLSESDRIVRPGDLRPGNHDPLLCRSGPLQVGDGNAAKRSVANGVMHDT